MLEVDVRGRFGDFLLDARFTARDGLTALFGRSGAGKTSLIKPTCRPGHRRGRTHRHRRPGALRFEGRRRRGTGAPPPRLRVSGRPPIPPHERARQPRIRHEPGAARGASSGPAAGRRTPRPGAPFAPTPEDTVGRREAEGGHRPRPAGKPAAAAHGRAAGIAGHGAQERDSALHRAACATISHSPSFTSATPSTRSSAWPTPWC